MDNRGGNGAFTATNESGQCIVHTSIQLTRPSRNGCWVYMKDCPLCSAYNDNSSNSGSIMTTPRKTSRSEEQKDDDPPSLSPTDVNLIPTTDQRLTAATFAPLPLTMTLHPQSHKMARASSLKQLVLRRKEKVHELRMRMLVPPSQLNADAFSKLTKVLSPCDDDSTRPSVIPTKEAKHSRNKSDDNCGSETSISSEAGNYNLGKVEISSYSDASHNMEKRTKDSLPCKAQVATKSTIQTKEGNHSSTSNEANDKSFNSETSQHLGQLKMYTRGLTKCSFYSDASHHNGKVTKDHDESARPNKVYIISNPLEISHDSFAEPTHATIESRRSSSLKSEQILCTGNKTFNCTAARCSRLEFASESIANGLSLHNSSYFESTHAIQGEEACKKVYANWTCRRKQDATRPETVDSVNDEVCYVDEHMQSLRIAHEINEIHKDSNRPVFETMLMDDASDEDSYDCQWDEWQSGKNLTYFRNKWAGDYHMTFDKSSDLNPYDSVCQPMPLMTRNNSQSTNIITFRSDDCRHKRSNFPDLCKRSAQLMETKKFNKTSVSIASSASGVSIASLISSASSPQNNPVNTYVSIFSSQDSDSSHASKRTLSSCDSLGRCVYHPHIQLKTRKLFGGLMSGTWKTVTTSCVECAVEEFQHLTQRVLREEEKNDCHDSGEIETQSSTSVSDNSSGSFVIYKHLPPPRRPTTTQPKIPTGILNNLTRADDGCGSFFLSSEITTPSGSSHQSKHSPIAGKLRRRFSLSDSIHTPESKCTRETDCTPDSKRSKGSKGRVVFAGRDDIMYC